MAIPAPSTRPAPESLFQPGQAALPRFGRIPLLSGEDLEKYAQVRSSDQNSSSGAAISLDTKELKYLSYFAHIKRRIERVWRYPADAVASGAQGQLHLKFVLRRNGQLKNVELLRSSGGYFDLRYTTIADNGSDDSALIRFDAPGGFAAGNSLLYDDNGAGTGLVVATPSGTTYDVDCVLVHEDGALAGQANVTNLIVADPQWDTSGWYPAGLYVPGPDSPAVDACGSGPGAIPDLLGTARPQDLPRPDGVGPFDMGAIERLPDRIFGDGFEMP